MSKDQKPTREKLVETVENLQHLISWISSSIQFWHMDDIFPTNLIKKCCDDFYEDIENLLDLHDHFSVS